MRNWFAVHTHPQGEIKAAHHLERQGFEVYLPRYMKKRSHARRIDWVPSPLFPRYLFVGMDLGKERWLAVSSTVGVSHLVCFGTRPIPVPSEIIEMLRGNEDHKGIFSFRQKAPFTLGDKVEIMSGAFSEAVGIFENLDAQGRVTLLLNIMGRQTKVKTSLECVSAVA